MRASLAIALSVTMATRALGQDGGIARDAYRCPTAPPAEQLDGGWFLPDAREARVSCLMAACAADRDELERQQSEQGAVLVKSFLVALAIGFSAGLVSGLFVKAGGK